MLFINFLFFIFFHICTQFDGIGISAVYCLYKCIKNLKTNKRLNYKKNRKTLYIYKKSKFQDLKKKHRKRKLSRRVRLLKIKNIFKSFKVINNFDPNDQEIEKYCKLYKYDGKNRNKAKQLEKIELKRGKVCPNCGPNETHQRTSHHTCPEYKKKTNINKNDISFINNEASNNFSPNTSNKRNLELDKLKIF